MNAKLLPIMLPYIMLIADEERTGEIMTGKRSRVTIGGVVVKIVDGARANGADGNSQTLNVFDETNTDGNYREVYRLPWGNRVTDSKPLDHQVHDLAELDEFAMSRDATKEGPRRRH